MLNLKRIVSALSLAAILPFSALAAERTAAAPIISGIPVASSVVDAIWGYFGGDDEPKASAPAARIVLAAAENGERHHELRFTMTHEIEKYVDHYASGRGRETTRQGLARSADYRARAEQIFTAEGVPAKLVWLAQVESGWKSEAVSPVGAGGVWQFMPATARDFGMRVDDEVDERLDFEKATRASARYLKRLSKRYDGNWELAIGAYNCGEGAMDRAIERAGGVENFWVLARAGVLPDETARYVPAVLAATIVGAELG